MDEVRSVIDPSDLSYLWLTHPDADHIGSLRAILDEAPQMKLVTTYLGYGILGLIMDIPLDRIYLVNPGEGLDVGDRVLRAYKPASFDNPSTTGFFDEKSRTLFSSDSFGALLQSTAEDASDISADDLRAGQITWATVDAPWLHRIDQGKFAASLNVVREMAPERILSSHLPPAKGSFTDFFIESLASAPDAPAFIGPNQAALETMIVAMQQGEPVPA
jgi:hypothetical protein